MLYDSELCARCKGRGYCGKPCMILAKFKILGKPRLHFSGSSPPEIFVGRFNYPNINTGILSPQEYGNTESYSKPELWFSEKANIEQILEYRNKLIYARFKSHIKDAKKEKRFLNVMQEVSLASKPLSAEFILKKKPHQNINIDKHVPIIGNPAPLKKVRLEENPKIKKKVEYLTLDTDSKAATSIAELYKADIDISDIIKILSAGMLGLKINRKLVPTRWSVTCVDDTISKLLLEKIRYYQEINEIQVFHSEYIGNHYEFLLLPDKFSFEVIEAKMSGSVWNPIPESKTYIAQDYEPFTGRKKYADNVTGAYYSNRLALCEHLEKIKRQASCFVIRECRPEYYAPLGTGILREASRDAFKNKPEIFNTIQEAFQKIQTRLKLPVELFKNNSQLLQEYGKQKRLSQFFRF